MAIVRFTQARAEASPLLTKARIRVYPKGTIRLGKAVLSLLDVEPGGRVEVKHDDESKEWYLCKSGEGLKVWPKKGDVGGAIYSRDLCQAIVDDVDEVTWDVGRVFTVSTKPVHVEGMKCYAILTSSAR